MAMCARQLAAADGHIAFDKALLSPGAEHAA
jgi:hypothetical protein